MQSSLKKSLYLGLAALSFVAAAGVATSSADAASKATIKSNTTLTTAGSTRNVTLTGTNALYTKPGTVKGAKVVASTTTAKRLSDSKKSLDNFRAYRVAVTSRGSVYYKVVSFDGDYRGWVYGGKDTTKFAAGVKSYATFTEKAATADQTSNYYKFRTTGAEAGGQANYANAGQKVTYKEAAWTQYKVGRAFTDSSDYSKLDDLIVDKAGTRGRENDEWVHVTSVSHPAVNGWILASSLVKTSVKAIPASEGITVKYVSALNGSAITTKVIAVPLDNGKPYTDVKAFIKQLQADVQTAAPAGFQSRAQDFEYITTPLTAGSTVTVATQTNTPKTKGDFQGFGFGTSSIDNLQLSTAQKANLNAAVKAAGILGDQNVDQATRNSILTAAGLDKFNFTADGKTYEATLVPAATAGYTTTNNDTLGFKAYYTVKDVTATADASANGAETATADSATATPTNATSSDKAATTAGDKAADVVTATK